MNYIYKSLNKTVILCSMFLSLILTTPAFSGNFSSGVFSFQQKLANNGNAQAQYKLGTMYESGRGVASNSDEALNWYQKSAAQNYRPAADRITYVEIKKTGFKTEKHSDWVNQLKQTANSGDGEAMMLLGQSYKNGVGVKKNLAKAQALFAQAAKKDIAGAEAELEASTVLIKAQQSKLAQQRKRAEDEKRRKQVTEKQAVAKKQQQEQERIVKQKATTDEQKRIELDRQRLEAEKRKLQQQKLELAKQQQQTRQKQAKQQQQKQQKAAKAAAPTKPEAYQKDVCKGKKARFLTVCK